jgi:outer membrane protein, heavy metal efflux system
MNISALIAWLLSVLIFISPITHGKDQHEDRLATNPNLSVRQVLNKVVERQPQQILLQARTSVVKAKSAMAESWLPQAPSMSLYHQTDTVGSGRNERDWQAEFELPIWLPNQKASRIKVASSSQSLLENDFASYELYAAGLLREALWDIAINNNEVSLNTEKLATAKGLEGDISKRYQAGEVAKTDVMQVQQETLLAEKNLVRAQAELMHARFRYQQLTGLEEVPADFEETISTRNSYENSAAWKAAESKVKLAEEERDLSSIERRENMQVILNARNSRGAFDTNYNQSVGVRVRIPLDTAVRSAPILAASEQALAEAVSQRETLRIQLQNAMHEAEHNLEVSEEELKISERQWLIAKENAQLATKAYQQGETDLFQLLRTQSQASEAERSYTTRQLQVKWNIAKYNQAVGTLP